MANQPISALSQVATPLGTDVLPDVQLADVNTQTKKISLSQVQTFVTTNPTITGAITIPNTGLHILDTNASNYLAIQAGSDLTSNRTLNLITGDANRTITLSGSPTLNDWFDQSVKAASFPTFNGLNVTAAINMNSHLISNVTNPVSAQDAATKSYVDSFGTGGVNPGTINDLGYYASTGDTISPLATGNSGVLITSNIGAPSISSTLPIAVQSNITTLGVQASALNMNSHQINNLTDPTLAQDAATKAYVDSFGTGGVNPGTINNITYYASTGDTVSALATANNGVLVTSNTGVPSISSTLPTAVQTNITSLGTQGSALNMGSHLISNVTDPVGAQDAATKAYVDSFGTGKVNPGTINDLTYYAATGDTVSALATANNGILVTSNTGVPSISSTLPTAVQGNITSLGAQSSALNMNSHLINNVTDPVSAQDAATKAYVDSFGTGSVNPGSANDLGYYAASSSTISPIATANNGTLITSNTGVPSISSTLPTAVQANIVQLGTQSVTLNMGSHLISNVTDPIGAQDAATKAYVDSFGTGNVNPGTANQIGYYATTSSTISGFTGGNNGTLITSNTGVPSISSTLPSAVQGNITTLGVQSAALNMGAHQINNVVDPTSPQDVATKAYADTISAGFDFKNSCAYATIANLSATYVNGVAGIGATLTNTGLLAAFAVDGATPAINSRILVKNQTSAFQNGIYTVTTVGSGAIAWILTRATDYDQTSEIQPGDLIPVEFGTTNAQTTWLQTATVTTIGTDSITFTQFSYAASASNIANTLVLRDGAGNFAASGVTVSNIFPTTTGGIQGPTSGYNVFNVYNTSALVYNSWMIASAGNPASVSFGNSLITTNIDYAAIGDTGPSSGKFTTLSQGGKTISLGGNLTTVGAFSTAGAGSYSFVGNLTANTNVTFPTSGTLAVTGSTDIPWSLISTDTTISANTGTINTGASNVLTLPVTFAVGDIIEVVAGPSAAFSISQNSGQKIHYLNSVTTTGVTGGISSTVAGNSVRMVGYIANTDFIILSGLGNITIT